MIGLKNLTKIYRMGEQELHALKDVSINIERGEFVAIMGPSGSGKSTMMNIIGCLDTPTGGTYYLEDTDISKFTHKELATIRNKKIGFVFQNFNLLARQPAISNVELPLIYSGNTNGRRKVAMELLRAMNLSDWAMHKPNELSGGQQQRIAIARALVNKPALILADEPTGNLDSKTQEEIMAIFKQLNSEGITIVLITHEESVAAHTKRIVRMLDGNIVNDSNVTNTAVAVSAAKSSENKIRRQFSFGMLKENFAISISSIFSHKLRSFLTALGIIIGVTAVITMVSLGEGAKSQVTASIRALGTNLLTISPGASRMGHGFGARGTIQTLIPDDAKAIAEECKSISKVDPNYSSNAQVVHSNKNMNTSIMGTSENFPGVRNFTIKDGSFFNENAIRMKQRVAVLGETVLKELFDENENPVGQYIKINRVNFLVIGVLSPKASTSWRDENDMVVIPVTTAQKRLFGVEHLSSIYVEAKSQELVKQAEKEIDTVLRQRHKTKVDEDADFHVRSMQEMLSTMEATTKTFTNLLAGIAAVSLLVGGIGIMNIMLVSVTERTREIGIRKAIGAQRRDILIQFLVEAIVLSLVGGIIGILLGSGASGGVSKLAGWPTLISPVSVILAFSFSVCVGLFFGYYPAYKASLLNPIEALRYE